MTFNELWSTAERETFLRELLDQEPDAVPVVLGLAPQLHVDAALASILHRILEQGLDSGLLGVCSSTPVPVRGFHLPTVWTAAAPPSSRLLK